MYRETQKIVILIIKVRTIDSYRIKIFIIVIFSILLKPIQYLLIKFYFVKTKINNFIYCLISAKLLFTISWASYWYRNFLIFLVISIFFIQINYTMAMTTILFILLVYLIIILTSSIKYIILISLISLLIICIFSIYWSNILFQLII